MNIFVGNLNPETVADGLRTLFSEFGEILSSKVIIDNATGMSRCFGFVEIADTIAAQDAIDNLDMSFFEGNIISVKEAKQSNTRPAPGGGYNANRGGSGGSGGQRPFRPGPPRQGGGGGYNNNYNKNY